MADTRDFPIGQRINLPGHSPEPVVLGSVRSIGGGYECRVRLPDGSPGEAIPSLDEASGIPGLATTAETNSPTVDAEQARLLVESVRIRVAQERVTSLRAREVASPEVSLARQDTMICQFRRREPPSATRSSPRFRRNDICGGSLHDSAR